MFAPVSNNRKSTFQSSSKRDNKLNDVDTLISVTIDLFLFLILTTWINVHVKICNGVGFDCACCVLCRYDRVRRPVTTPILEYCHGGAMRVSLHLSQ